MLLWFCDSKRLLNCLIISGFLLVVTYSISQIKLAIKPSQKDLDLNVGPLIPEVLGNSDALTHSHVGVTSDSPSPDKKCSRCKKLKPRSNFHINKSKSDCLDTRCAQCICEVRKLKRQSKKRQMLEANRRGNKFSCRATGSADLNSIGDFVRIFSDAIGGLIENGQL